MLSQCLIDRFPATVQRHAVMLSRDTQIVLCVTQSLSEPFMGPIWVTIMDRHIFIHSFGLRKWSPIGHFRKDRLAWGLNLEVHPKSCTVLVHLRKTIFLSVLKVPEWFNKIQYEMILSSWIWRLFTYVPERRDVRPVNTSHSRIRNGDYCFLYMKVEWINN